MEREIIANFTEDREWFENQLGTEYPYTASTGPYEYLLGALAGCFFRTMKSHVATKLWEELTIKVGGNKRKEGITTLSLTRIEINAIGVKDQEQFKEAVDYAASHCSIYNTISQVSEMELVINYV